jgi:predicted nucleotidyltransferase
MASTRAGYSGVLQLKNTTPGAFYPLGWDFGILSPGRVVFPQFPEKALDWWSNPEKPPGGLGMTLEELLKAKREEILRVCARYGAYNVRVFGSVARGEATEESDIDLIVDFEPGRSLLDHAGLWLELQELLGVRVDVVSSRGIKARIRERVLQEAVPL